MKSFSSITGLLAAPVQFVNPAHFAVALGLQLDNNAIIWSRCNFFTPTHETFNSINELLTKNISPLWVNQSLENSLSLIESLWTIARTVTYEEKLIPEKKEGVSRREMLLSKLHEEVLEPQLVVTTVQEPLPSIVIHALVVLLLKAWAQDMHMSPLEALSQLFEQPIIKLTPRPTHFSLPKLGDVIDPFTPTLLSMGYALLPFEEEEVMGKGGELFQRHVRRLKEHLRRSKPKGKHIYLEFLGAYGRLYNNEVGRILGACLGLEHAVKPCTVWLEDPILLDEETENITLTAKLKSYIRRRRLKTKLVAHFGVDSVTAVSQIIKNNTAHGVRLSLSQFKSLSQLIEAIKLCQQNEISLILGDRHSSPELLAWLGVLFQPRLLYTANPHQTAQTSTEMYQAVMEQNKRAGLL